MRHLATREGMYNVVGIVSVFIVAATLLWIILASDTYTAPVKPIIVTPKVVDPPPAELIIWETSTKAFTCAVVAFGADINTVQCYPKALIVGNAPENGFQDTIVEGVWK